MPVYRSMQPPTRAQPAGTRRTSCCPAPAAPAAPRPWRTICRLRPPPRAPGRPFVRGRDRPPPRHIRFCTCRRESPPTLHILAHPPVSTWAAGVQLAHRRRTVHRPRHVPSAASRLQSRAMVAATQAHALSSAACGLAYSCATTEAPAATRRTRHSARRRLPICSHR